MTRWPDVEDYDPIADLEDTHQMMIENTGIDIAKINKSVDSYVIGRMSNKIFNWPMEEILPKMPDSCIDLILTDPPYLIDYQSNRRVKTEKFKKLKHDKPSDANRELIALFMKESYRLLRDNSHIYVFCSWHNIDVFKQLFETYFTLKNVLIWEKNNHGSGDLKGAFAPKYEMILFGHKGRRTLNYTRRPDDILPFAKVPSSRLLHPTQKPVELIEFLIGLSSKEGDIVLDPFLGVGTTAKAAKNMNRNYIGIEIEEEMFNIARRELQ